MKKITKLSLLVLFTLTATLSVSAQQSSRQTIKDAIKSEEKCYNVAITRTNGDAALFNTSCVISGNSALKEEYYDWELLASAYSYYYDVYNDYKDITITESGEWLMLVDKNTYSYSSGAPSELKEKLEQLQNGGDTFNSASFNDNGDWIIVTQEHISASNTKLQDWVVSGIEEYGAVWTAYLTDDGAVAVYELGIMYYGEVPQGLKDAIKETKLNYYFVKFAGTSYFFADKEGNYQYRM